MHSACQEKISHTSLHAKGWMEVEACLVTVDTGQPMTIATLNIIAELPKRDAHEMLPAHDIREEAPDLEGSSSDSD
jgi:hypothetical protein